MHYLYLSLVFLTLLTSSPVAAEVHGRTIFQQNDADISDKPTFFDAKKTVIRKCREMSQRALAAKTNVLVIGFEGLISADHFGVSAAYRYERDLADKKTRAVKPLPSPIDGWVLHGLMVPLIEKTKGGVKTLTFPHYSQGLPNEAPATCAKIWLSEPMAKNRKLVILGHSMGGLSAGLLARQLEKQNLAVDLLVTLDPVQAWLRPQNTKRWENYQGVLPVFLNGPGADLHRYIFHPLYSNHFTMTRYPEIFNSLSRQVIQMMEKKPGREKVVPKLDLPSPPRCTQCGGSESAL